MTLTEYEGSLVTMPGWQRGNAAGAAYALRQQLANGEPFVAARDRVANDEWHHRALTNAESYVTFAALSGP